MILMATSAQPEVLYGLMEWVTTLSLLFVIIATITMVRRRLRHFKTTKTGLGSVLVWIAATFVIVSVLLNTAAGALVGLFLTETMGWGYVKPITVAFDVFLVGAAIMLSAGIVAYLTHERKPKQGRRKSRQNDPQETDETPMGIEFFTTAGR